MAPKENKGKEPEGAGALPPAIIAQAEAAILGNFGDRRNSSDPRLARTRSEYHEYQNDLSGGDGATLRK